MLVNRKGRFPDLLVRHGQTFQLGVGEVKSPSERDAWITQAYKKRDYNLRGMSRREIYEELASLTEGHDLKLAHLLGVTFTNQLYCYCWDIVERPHVYRKIVPAEWASGLPSSVGRVNAYLIVPVEWQPIVQLVMENLTALRNLLSLLVKVDSKLSAFQISYPDDPPINLAG